MNENTSLEKLVAAPIEAHLAILVLVKPKSTAEKTYDSIINYLSDFYAQKPEGLVFVSTPFIKRQMEKHFSPIYYSKFDMDFKYIKDDDGNIIDQRVIQDKETWYGNVNINYFVQGLPAIENFPVDFPNEWKGIIQEGFLIYFHIKGDNGVKDRGIRDKNKFLEYLRRNDKLDTNFRAEQH